VGGSARDENGWSANVSPFSASAMNYVRITGQVDGGNLAPSVTVQLFDVNLNSVFFSVSTSAFATGSLTQVQIPITSWDSGFDSTKITSWSIGGGTAGLVTFHMTLDNLALSSSLIPLSGGGNIVTAGNQTYTSPVTLGAATTLGTTGSNGNAITFNTTIDGGHALTLNTPGATTLGAAVGNTTPLASLTTNSGGSTAINGGKVVTTGGQSYHDSVTLGADTLLKSSAGGVNLAGTLSGNGHSLVLDVNQASSLGSATNLSALTKNGTGTLTLTSQSTYTGRTTLNSGTLALGLDQALASASPLTLAGGVLATGGFSQTLASLTLSGDATIDFGVGTSMLVFGDSHSLSWTGRLSVINFTPGTDTLRFGTSGTALTPGQLALLDFGPGFAAAIDGNGFVSMSGITAVPEPATCAAIMGALALAGAGLRRAARTRAQRSQVSRSVSTSSARSVTLEGFTK
jgi:autotransporter-associated beta strand protein